MFLLNASNVNPGTDLPFTAAWQFPLDLTSAHSGYKIILVLDYRSQLLPEHLLYCHQKPVNKTSRSWMCYIVLPPHRCCVVFHPKQPCAQAYSLATNLILSTMLSSALCSNVRLQFQVGNALIEECLRNLQLGAEQPGCT
jgi:hypothetical protein